MFKYPRPLAHLSFALVMIGLALQSINEYVIKEFTVLVPISMAFYLAAFPFAILTLMRNWRVPREKRIDLWGSVEVGVGLLPFIITVILVIYALYFAKR